MWIVLGHFEDGERFWSKWTVYDLAREELQRLKNCGGLWAIIFSEDAKDLVDFF